MLQAAWTGSVGLVAKVSTKTIMVNEGASTVQLPATTPPLECNQIPARKVTLGFYLGNNGDTVPEKQLSIALSWKTVYGRGTKSASPALPALTAVSSPSGAVRRPGHLPLPLRFASGRRQAPAGGSAPGGYSSWQAASRLVARCVASVRRRRRRGLRRW
uniref:Uncharacterized protein n=1 Tax=Oryza sativa subsp. japonica TaxID=39947 RepID=Q6EP18_ORYSJ|nr:hypothetical protein [Oryza sativa Japonica Group]BAD29602.1 hypothetical protein [Oryza sativa Japonica Group]